MNPQDTAGRAAIANQAAQATPGALAYQAVLDNRSVQLNASPPPAAKSASKQTSEGSSSSGSQ
jgi:hypothetical protein